MGYNFYCIFHVFLYTLGIFTFRNFWGLLSISLFDLTPTSKTISRIKGIQWEETGLAIPTQPRSATSKRTFFFLWLFPRMQQCGFLVSWAIFSLKSCTEKSVWDFEKMARDFFLLHPRKKWLEENSPGGLFSPWSDVSDPGGEKWEPRIDVSVHAKSGRQPWNYSHRWRLKRAKTKH